MAWPTAIADLRALLNDGATDKLRHRKAVFGEVNGTNVVFKTFEFRRITDFTTAVAPLGVFIRKPDGSAPQATVSLDNVAVGEFTISSAAPLEGEKVECTYYSQWFLDPELTTFLRSASDWLGLGDDYTTMDPGLQPAAKRYAGYEAYQKLALKYAEYISETYRLEDAEDPKKMQVVDAYQKAAQDLYQQAIGSRNDFYSRQGQALAPLNRSLAGRVRSIVPRG